MAKSKPKVTASGKLNDILRSGSSSAKPPPSKSKGTGKTPTNRRRGG